MAADALTLAVVGDLHWHVDQRPTFHHHFKSVHEVADFLILPGDLTGAGLSEEARLLAEVLAKVRIPVIAVLGNHDVHTDNGPEVTRILEDAGVRVLHGGGDAVTFTAHGMTVGFCGTKGFCGGFGARCLTPFGEPAIKEFIAETKEEAARVDHDLRDLHADFKVVIFHYSPIETTVQGEPRELYPFLGSSLLCEPVDKLGANLVVHGHAHLGAERGHTESGIPVRNVALPVLKRSYAILEFAAETRVMRATGTDG
ncbi:MAG: Calcineurin-like phosphoesterase superfamily domain protein [bacterium ADurb.Bin429]|nr:MAG: Calcineurin-like phosphoesterase superfamily domain protein [bacterium ADurb.Bin429]